MDAQIGSWFPNYRFAGVDVLFKVVLLACLTWLIFRKDVSLDFRLMAIPGVVHQEHLFPFPSILGNLPVRSPKPASRLSAAEQEQAKKIRNLSVILGKSYLERKKVPSTIIQEKLRVVRSYLKEFAPAAIREMKLHGIPASITLAQGLLESDAGGSRLATESNNHFGIKCKSKCIGCTCRNYADDDAYDMFKVYASARDSYTDHSQFLKGKRYRPLFRLNRMDYKGWAYGLKKAGYATDPKYAEKLIQIIEVLRLHRYDQPPESA